MLRACDDSIASNAVLDARDTCERCERLHDDNTGCGFNSKQLGHLTVLHVLKMLQASND